MLNSRPYSDEIRHAVFQFSTENPSAHVSMDTVVQSGSITNITVTVLGNQGLRDAARTQFQGIGEYCHVEEYDAPNDAIDFSWGVA